MGAAACYLGFQATWTRKEATEEVAAELKKSIKDMEERIVQIGIEAFKNNQKAIEKKLKNDLNASQENVNE